MEKKIAPKKAAFIAAYEALCREHNMRLGTDGNETSVIVIAYARDLEANSGIKHQVAELNKRDAWCN